MIKLTVFSGTLKRIFKQPFNWVILLVFPVLCYILLSLTVRSDNSDEAINISMYFGIVDNDNTVISETLAKSLGLRYNIIELEESDITAKLADQAVPWILLIREGYERDVLSKNTELTTLEGYSLTLSDMAVLGSATANNITRALMILGTNDEDVIAAWEEAALVESTAAETGDRWEIIAQWISMYGFISLFMAYFIIKTMLDDKRKGMPDRVGILPLSTRNYLVQGTFAAFFTTEITAALILVSLWAAVGSFPNVLLMFFLISLYNLFAVSFVLAVTSIAKNLEGISVIMTMFATLSAMLGGLFWPLEIVPDFMKKVAWFTPGYWFGEGLRNVREASFEKFVIPLLFLLGFTVITLLIGGFKKVQKIEE